MSTIPSALIQSTMTKVKNEMSQLEHWLLSLQETTPSVVQPQVEQNSLLYQKLDQLLKELEAQRHTIHHLMDRIEVLESRDDREIHIDETDEINDASWFDTSSVTPLQNIIIDPTESQYNILKTDSPKVEPVVLETDLSVIPVVQEEPKEEPKVEPVVVKEEPKVEPKVEPVVVKEEPKVEPKEEPVVVKEEPKVEPKEEPVEEEEEEAEEEEEEAEQEEEDEELEVLDFKGVTYCKDKEGFIYSLDAEGSLSEQPIGIWKAKTSSVSFYRKA